MARVKKIPLPQLIIEIFCNYLEGEFVPMIGSGYQAYQKSQILTADPKRLVLLCYEEAIQSLEFAKTKYLSKEYETKGKAVQKVLDLLNHLRDALDFERGGEIAKQLDRLYGFMIVHLLKSDRERDLKGFSEIAEMLMQLKSAWEEAMHRLPHKPLSVEPEGDLSFSLP